MRLRTASACALAALVVSLACKPPAPVPVYAVADRGIDSDGDGAADVDDACPGEAEDGLPPKANDGCPAEDPDNDGIVRADDKCPDAKEDGQPPDPSDGCPTVNMTAGGGDADHDGVADAADKCPTAAEDNLPPFPNDGCPGIDADKDGLADVIDQCPNEPETYNGFRDLDGCPDTPPTTELVFYDAASFQIYVAESVRLEFDPDSSKPTQKSNDTLSLIAKVLADHPEIERLEIEGHASSKGDDAHNLELTQARASAIADALIRLGTNGHRLVAIGYGEYCPAVDLGDGVEDARNRRILLKTVVVSSVWQPVQRGCWKAQTAVKVNPTQKKPVGTETKGGGV